MEALPFNCIMFNLKKFLFPSDLTCTLCRREKFNGGLLCDECLKSVVANDKAICQNCGRKVSSAVEYCERCSDYKRYVDLSRSLFIYSGSTRELIKRLKYDGDGYIADGFSDSLAKKAVAEIPAFDIITCVPMTKAKQKKRGYNQSELLAEKVAKRLCVDFKILLEKTCETASQVGLKTEERIKNLDGTFSVIDNSEISGKSVLIVDDVMTTGATSECMAKTLKKAGATKVYLLTVAHVDFDKKGI